MEKQARKGRKAVQQTEVEEPESLSWPSSVPLGLRIQGVSLSSKAPGANISRSPGQMHPVFNMEPSKLCVLRQTTAGLVGMRSDSYSTLEIQVLHLHW